MRIRSYSWGAADLSWSVVIEELLHASEELGHEPVFISTNGTQNMQYWDEKRLMQALVRERDLRRARKPFDIDITFTVPENFPQRFLRTSKVKMAIYDYESSHMPAKWKQFYPLIDYVLPASQYVADMFERNGCPKEKIQVVHHGVDTKLFNPDIKPLQLPTKKKFKFLCVAAPHYRKQLDKLLSVYCERFTADDDVTLIMKTKLFQNGDETKAFEMDLRPLLVSLADKHGKKMPEIKFLQGHLPSMGGLYTACDAFVLMTASEGWCIPYLESIACNLPVIAPRHGGQLDYLNDSNSLLCDTGIRKALPQEQYWGGHPDAIVGNPNEEHYGELMVRLFKEYDQIKHSLLPNMKKTVDCMTWESAAQKIINLARETGRV
jgi:glycosyltransferase involved in cell wall biosynthesis